MVGLERPTVLAILAILSPRIERTWAFCSFVTVICLPGFDPPQVLPASLAADWPARTRSALISVSYDETLAKTFAMRRPAGVDKSKQSRRLNSPIFRLVRWSNNAVKPWAVRPSRSSLQQTTLEILPASIASRNLFHDGLSIVRPVNLSRYQTTSPS